MRLSPTFSGTLTIHNSDENTAQNNALVTQQLNTFESEIKELLPQEASITAWIEPKEYGPAATLNFEYHNAGVGLTDKRLTFEAGKNNLEYIQALSRFVGVLREKLAFNITGKLRDAFQAKRFGKQTALSGADHQNVAGLVEVESKTDKFADKLQRVITDHQQQPNPFG